MVKEKIIFDTDIGDDIDDAYALAIGILSNKVDFLGITTVYKNVSERASIVLETLKDFCVNAEVYEGESKPIKVPFRKMPFDVNYPDGTLGVSHYSSHMPKNPPKDKDAVDFILETAKKYPNEVTLVGVGPLTNIAKAVEKDLQTFKLFKKVLLMAGEFTEHRAEWNVYCDPDAAKTVLQSGANVWCVGVDMTRQTTMPDWLIQPILNSKDTRFKELIRMSRVWMNNNDKNPVMHDGLLLSCLWQNFCTFRESGIKMVDEVENASKIFFDETSPYRINYADTVDTERFFKWMKELFIGES